MESQDKIVVAFNAGPGTISYPGPRSGEERDLVLRPWRHTIVPAYFQKNPFFRRDAKAGKFALKEVDDLPVDDHFKIDEQYLTLIPLLAQHMVTRLCSEEYKVDSRGMNKYRDLINLPDQIGPNGRPNSNSNVTVKYLKENHKHFLEAALELESRWQKRKPVIRDIKAALKKIAAL